MPERPGVDNFVRALGVRRHAKRGFALGVLFAALVFVVFVVLPGGVARSPALYVSLAFVLAFALGLLLTAIFVLGSLYRLTRDLD